VKSLQVALLFWASIISYAAPFPPLGLLAENPHYFLFRGEPTLIITSGEHYGAVLNLDFDYASYLSELQTRQLNGTRTFSGAYFEPQGAFNITDNTMAPANGRYIGPWPRTGVPGATHGGTKFDLTKWNDSYFARLRDFVRQASARGVIVEMNLFCPFYEEPQWRLSPMNVSNNVNNLGTIARTDVYTLDKSGGLLAVQEALTRKIVSELNQFDNVYYEICNEPYFGGVTMDWQRRISEVITEAERTLPNKHLISMNVANGSANVANPPPAVSIFNFHYAAPPDAVTLNYNLNRPIGDNETGFRGTNDLPYRREAWEFILAGGALYNNLDYSFTVRHPRGTFVNYPASQPGGGNPAFREQLRVLRNFMHGFEFWRMAPTNLIRSGVPAGSTARMLAEPGKAYAVYLGPAAPINGDKFSVRWTGRLRVPRSGDYIFYTTSNDGARLTIDGQVVIDDWVAHSKKEMIGKINLKTGRAVSIIVEYYQLGGEAQMQLSWQPPRLPRSIIPVNMLFNNRNTPGLQAEYFVGENFNRLGFARIDPVINFDWTGKSPFSPDVTPGPKTINLEIDLAPGAYEAHWINTRTGITEKTQRVEHRRGTRVFQSPPYDQDIAFEIQPATLTPSPRTFNILK
jgi:hypothetical protein